MRDEQAAQFQFLLEILQQVDDDGLHRDVQSGCGFVQHQKLGTHDQGSGDGDALSLTAGEFMRIALIVGAGQPYPLKHGKHLLLSFCSSKLCMNGQGSRYDLFHGGSGIQGCIGILKDHLHLRAQAA